MAVTVSSGGQCPEEVKCPTYRRRRRRAEAAIDVISDEKAMLSLCGLAESTREDRLSQSRGIGERRQSARLSY